MKRFWICLNICISFHDAGQPFKIIDIYKKLASQGKLNTHLWIMLGEENIEGSITVGKFADIVVLSQDILTIPDEQIKETKVLYTILGGKIKYQNNGIPK